MVSTFIIFMGIALGFLYRKEKKISKLLFNLIELFILYVAPCIIILNFEFSIPENIISVKYVIIVAALSLIIYYVPVSIISGLVYYSK